MPFPVPGYGSVLLLLVGSSPSGVPLWVECGSPTEAFCCCLCWQARRIIAGFTRSLHLTRLIPCIPLPVVFSAFCMQLWAFCTTHQLHFSCRVSFHIASFSSDAFCPLFSALFWAGLVCLSDSFQRRALCALLLFATFHINFAPLQNYRYFDSRQWVGGCWSIPSTRIGQPGLKLPINIL